MTPEEISEINSDAVCLDGFDDAIIGVAERINLGPVVAYDVDKILSILIDRDGMTYDDALEFFYYNVSGSWVGEFTPVFITKKK